MEGEKEPGMSAWREGNFEVGLATTATTGDGRNGRYVVVQSDILSWVDGQVNLAG